MKGAMGAVLAALMVGASSPGNADVSVQGRKAVDRLRYHSGHQHYSPPPWVLRGERSRRGKR